MKKAVAALAVLLLAWPAVGQPQADGPADPGIAPIWAQALAGSLLALPREDPEDLRARWELTHRLAEGLSSTGAALGGVGSGPLLRSIGAGSARLLGTEADLEQVADLLSMAPAARQGALPDNRTDDLRQGLVQARWLLDDSREAADAHPTSEAAWLEADAWWHALASDSGLDAGHLAALAAAGLDDARAGLELGGSLHPGGRLVATLLASEPGQLVLPWATVPAPADVGRLEAPIPFSTPLGPFQATWAAGGRNVTADGVLGPIPVLVTVEGQRRVPTGTEPTLTLEVQSPVPTPPDTLLVVRFDSEALPAAEGPLTLPARPAGTYLLEVEVDPGDPWARTERNFTVVHLATATSGAGLDAPPAWAWGVLGALLLAGAASLAWRRRGIVHHPPTPVAQQGEARLGERLAAWWRRPAPSPVEDFRRAGRILRTGGEVRPGASAAEVGSAVQGRLRVRNAAGLADLYERTAYNDDAEAAEAYRRRRPAADGGRP